MTVANEIRPKHTDSLNHRSSCERVGHLSKALSHKDNGVYITGTIEGQPIEMLFDSGATATLISTEVFECLGDVQDRMREDGRLVQAIDGAALNVRGNIDVLLTIGNFEKRVNAIVCDIPIPGILGQDFIKKHISTWDIQKHILKTVDGHIIECESKSTDDIICRFWSKKAWTCLQTVSRWYQ